MTSIAYGRNMAKTKNVNHFMGADMQKHLNDFYIACFIVAALALAGVAKMFGVW